VNAAVKHVLSATASKAFTILARSEVG
jgi:hypothetical protein